MERKGKGRAIEGMTHQFARCHTMPTHFQGTPINHVNVFITQLLPLTTNSHHIDRVYMFSLLEFLTTNPPSLPCENTVRDIHSMWVQGGFFLITISCLLPKSLPGNAPVSGNGMGCNLCQMSMIKTLPLRSANSVTSHISKANEVQTSPLLASGTQLLPCGIHAC